MKKICYRCNRNLPLESFKDNGRYSIPSDKGKCKSCNECMFKMAVDEGCAIRFNYDTRKFEKITFDTIGELFNYFNNK